jgi:hypothetical protein
MVSLKNSKETQRVGVQRRRENLEELEVSFLI